MRDWAPLIAFEVYCLALALLLLVTGLGTYP